MNIQLSNVWLLTALLSGAAFAMAMVLLFIPGPDEIRDPVLRGYRATRRRDALASSGLLKLTWPMIRLCTFYALLIPAKDWKEKTSIKLRNAGEPWGLSPDEFMGLIMASTIGSAVLGFLFAELTEMGMGMV